MNKFLTFPGKQPVYLGDINFMQSAVGSAFANLMKAWIGDDDANAKHLELARGVALARARAAVERDGAHALRSLPAEVARHLAAGLADSQGGQLYINIVSSTSGSREFGDGTEHDCWEVRSATFTETVTDYPLSAFKRIVPVDVSQAKVYGFEGRTNSATSYAKLANAGGAWIFSMKIPEQLGASATLFQANVDGLPENALVYFATRTPSSVLATVRSANSEAPTIPVTLSWTVVNNKLQVTVTAGSALAIPNTFELREILPVF